MAAGARPRRGRGPGTRPATQLALAAAAALVALLLRGAGGGAGGLSFAPGGARARAPRAGPAAGAQALGGPAARAAPEAPGGAAPATLGGGGLACLVALALGTAVARRSARGNAPRTGVRGGSCCVNVVAAGRLAAPAPSGRACGLGPSIAGAATRLHEFREPLAQSASAPALWTGPNVAPLAAGAAAGRAAAPPPQQVAGEAKEAAPLAGAHFQEAFRLPRPARRAGRSRRAGCRLRRQAQANGGSPLTGQAKRTTRRRNGARLLERCATPEVAPLVYDSSAVRLQVQLGLRTTSRPRREHSRDVRSVLSCARLRCKGRSSVQGFRFKLERSRTITTLTVVDLVECDLYQAAVWRCSGSLATHRGTTGRWIGRCTEEARPQASVLWA